MKKTVSDFIPILLITIIISLVYIWTIPRQVVLEDDGYFIIAAYFNGVTHPPGYPLFIMLSHVFTWLPFGSVAFKVHLASSFFGVLACIALWYITKTLFKDQIYAIFAALGLAFSISFWSQAIIAEVYTLNVLLFLVLFLLALKCTDTDEQKRNRYLKYLALCYGISLSNHWPLIVLSTPALLVLLWPLRQYLYRNFYRYIFYLLPGLLPYMWLVWRSHVAPEISFYGPIDSFEDFWHYVSRREYTKLDYSSTAGLIDKLNFFGFILNETARQVGFFGMVFVITGFLSQWYKWPVRLCLSLSLAYLGNTFFIILLRDADFDYFSQVSFLVFPLISYSVCWIWAALGLFVIIDKITSLSHTGFHPKILSGAVTVLIIGVLFLNNININNRHNDNLAYDYGKLVLDTLDSGSVFYSNADNIDGPISYLNKVEKYRPDVTVFTGRYLIVEGTLFRPFQLNPPELRQLIARYLENTEETIYYTNAFPNAFGVTRYGFYSAVNRDLSSNREKVIVNTAFQSFLAYWSDKYNNYHPWNKMHYKLLMADYCHLLLTLRESENLYKNNAELEQLINFNCSHFQGTLNLIEITVNSEKMDSSLLLKLFEQAEGMSDDAFTKMESSRLDYYKGLYHLRLNNTDLAKIAFEASIAIWPHTENPSAEMLQRLGDNG